MKIITLAPIKNEEWILDSYLKNASLFSDHIILADQNSTDRSREIALMYPKVMLIENNEKGHSNKARFLLLEEARKIPGNNLIICLDADEAIPPLFFKNLDSFLEKMRPGEWIEFEWIQLWKSSKKYRVDGVWKDSWKAAAFFDDRKLEYEKEIVTNDHTRRVPGRAGNPSIRSSFPILHFQFTAWERMEIKQAWYRISELIQNRKGARRINHKYAHALDSKKEILRDTKEEWLSGLSLPKNPELAIPSHQYREILEWFDEYGILFFEPLQIWHIKALHDEFIRRVGREPKIKTYSSFLILLNSWKNKIIKRK